VAWFFCWMIALSTYEPGAAEATDHMRAPGWTGNPWGPAAQRARTAGLLPPVPISPRMAQWERWGKTVLHDGDIVFRLGDARTLNGWFPLSFLIAQATASPFSHTGVVAIENGSPIVYDCSSSGVQRQPFSVWMLDCVGPLGIKRLKREHRGRIPGVLAFCRDVFEQQVPFDYEFRPDDSKLYCLELTEKAFRSQGLALSEPVRIGDWEDLVHFPLTALAFVRCSGWALDHPISLEQEVYLPGNERHGMWSSPLLETVFCSQPKPGRQASAMSAGGLSLRGDLGMAVFVAGEMRRSYSELPARWIYGLVLKSRIHETTAPGADDRQVSLNRDRKSRPL
jgi:Permuted papain-like amidase enzyme, YaeF/YiiX, C92 family